MGRVYTAIFDNVAVTAAQDLFYLAPADDKPICIHAIFVGQSTEVGDAMEEFLRWSIIRGHATVGSGGSAPTPAPVDPVDTAAGAGARVNDTTPASAGTGVTLHADTFNVRAGLSVIFPPEMRYEASQANTSIVIRLLSTPADSITMSGTVVFEEM